MAESEASVPRLGLSSYLVLAAVAIVPGIFATGFTQFETVKEVALLYCGGAGLVAWGLAVLRGKRISMTGGRLSALILAFAAFCLLALLWAGNWQAGMVPALHWVAAVGLFVFVTSPVGRPLDFRTVAIAASVGAIVAGSSGLLDLMGVSLFTEVWDPPGAAGSFDAREFAVAYYAAVLPFLAAAAMRVGGVGRVLAIIGGVLAAAHFGLVADMDFLAIWAGTVAVATALVLMLQGFVRMPLLYRPMLAIAVMGGLAFGIAALKPNVREVTDATGLPWVNAGQVEAPDGAGLIRDVRFAIRRTEEATNWQARSYALGVAFDLLREEPIIGHGPGGWWPIQTKYFRQGEPYVQGVFDRWPAFRSPHNSFALVMAEYGAIGLFLLVAWLSALFGVTLTALSKKEEPESWVIEHWGLTSAVLSGVVLSAVTPGLDRAPAAVIVFVLAGLLVRESAALNEFKGLSEVWNINKDGRRFDTSLFCGALPMAVGVGAIVFGSLFVAAEFFRSWGDLAMLRAQHDVAEDVYARSQEILGKDGEVLYNRALAKKRVGQLGESIELVNQAMELRPYDVRIMNVLSSIHLGNQKYSDAVIAARRAIDLFPNYVEGRRNLAAALDLQGRSGDAANELLKILELDPPDLLAGKLHREIGAYYEGPLDNPTKALEHYQKAKPLIVDAFVLQQLVASISELEKEVERRRLMREGKPIPPSLMPGKAPGDLPKRPGAPAAHDGHEH